MDNTCDRCQCLDCKSTKCPHPCKWVQMACMAPVTVCSDYKEKTNE